jgi:hypothetical protein
MVYTYPLYTSCIPSSGEKSILHVLSVLRIFSCTLVVAQLQQKRVLNICNERSKGRPLFEVCCLRFCRCVHTVLEYRTNLSTRTY